MKIEEFTVTAGEEPLKCTLALPEETDTGENSALLMNISATADLALHDETQNHPTQPFLDAGHFVVTFDLPLHGERVSTQFGEGLHGMGKAYLAGVDPFEQFILDGKTTLDACLERGIGQNGKIVAYGVSRAGYALLRLAAADSRLRAVAALSSVTDWSVPGEFSESCPRAHALEFCANRHRGKRSEKTRT